MPRYSLAVTKTSLRRDELLVGIWAEAQTTNKEESDACFILRELFIYQVDTNLSFSCFDR